ncbi:sugar-binding domain-containing protein [Arcticibacter sp. MXS-1]|uniref:sugar-binding domain-containing protein n=1 Tax=Arcticibacter sp. MXS-1 TaxID=3341726 RepID=UPI0035A856FC
MNYTKHLAILFSACLFCITATAQSVRKEYLLDKNWKFKKGDFPEAIEARFNDLKWETVTIPHDWAIKGPFDGNNDVQKVRIEQNLEKEESVKSGRTGGLPFIGSAWYRLKFRVPTFLPGKKATLLFDGAMSNARVYVNGKEAGFWPYGYNSFQLDVTSFLNPPGEVNTLAVRLENFPESSRWYPGAGLYRNVHLFITEDVHVPVWGTYITTPEINAEYAKVRVKTKVETPGGLFRSCVWKRRSKTRQAKRWPQQQAISSRQTSRSLNKA